MRPVHSAEYILMYVKFVYRDGHRAIDGFVEQRQARGFLSFC